MRLINEDDVLRIVERMTNEAVEKNQRKYLIQSRIIAEIAGLPTIEAEPVNDWISIKDRLPDKDGLYIVCKTIKPHQIVFEARWKANKWLSVVKNNQLDYVTHWQSLPKPPKKLSREESDEQLYGGYEEDRKTMIGSNE